MAWKQVGMRGNDPELLAVVLGLKAPAAESGATALSDLTEAEDLLDQLASSGMEVTNADISHAGQFRVWWRRASQ
jgi:hypothetical protein